MGRRWVPRAASHYFLLTALLMCHLLADKSASTTRKGKKIRASTMRTNKILISSSTSRKEANEAVQ
jgi:hypothetical protein